MLDRQATDGFVTDVGHILRLFFRDPDGLEAETHGCCDDMTLVAHRAEREAEAARIGIAACMPKGRAKDLAEFAHDLVSGAA